MSDDTDAVPLSESHTEMTEMLLPDSTNALGRALGGVVLHWMDICGAISAMRFANQQCVTASMDHVDFIAPIDVGEIAVIKAYVFNTGQTSVDVKVDVHSEDPRTGEIQETTTSFLTYVAIDDEGHPTAVPDVVCEEEAEAELRDAAVEKRQTELESIIERMREEY
jgi:acyl-CoA hydrolase